VPKNLEKNDKKNDKNNFGIFLDIIGGYPKKCRNYIQKNETILCSKASIFKKHTLRPTARNTTKGV
jgi:hypothetical protein